jgi:hypothetical protein
MQHEAEPRRSALRAPLHGPGPPTRGSILKRNKRVPFQVDLTSAGRIATSIVAILYPHPIRQRVDRDRCGTAPGPTKAAPAPSLAPERTRTSGLSRALPTGAVPDAGRFSRTAPLLQCASWRSFGVVVRSPRAQPRSGRCGSNLRRLRAARTSRSRSRPKSLQMRRIFPEPSNVTHVESGLKPERRRRSSRLHTENRPQMRAFWRAAEGIRTLDLLHGRQNAQRGFLQNVPVNRRFLDGQRRLRSPALTGKSRGFGHRMGTRAAYSMLAGSMLRPPDDESCSAL